jgi:hypothetical protein
VTNARQISFPVTPTVSLRRCSQADALQRDSRRNLPRPAIVKQYVPLPTDSTAFFKGDHDENELISLCALFLPW